MKLTPIGATPIKPYFRAKESAKPEIKEENNKQEEKKYTAKQNNTMVIGTALSTAILVGSVVHGRNKWKISRLENEVSELTGCRKILKETEQKVKDLTTNNETLSKLNKKLQREADKAKEKFTDIFEGDLAPKDLRDKIFNGLKNKIDNGDYGYDINNPPVTGKGSATIYPDAVTLPSSVGTLNRAEMIELQIPKIDSDGRFSYEVPMSNEVKITHAKSVDFTPVKSQPTNISESYADSVQWGNDKIARDILQNFYDGHGQTLDGVKLHFEPSGNGKFRVRIEGKSTYTPDKAILLGESTKRDDAKAAGNYGEGLKMATLKLLKNGGAPEVKIASDNWKVTYSLEKGNLSDKRVLSYSVDKTNKYDGNYIEFETSDRQLLESLRKTLNRFYSSGNAHFKCPDFENDILGIKNLPKGEKGGIYIAGQRFEFYGDYDGLDNIVIFLKEKPPKSILDPSRDRTSLNTSNLEDIARWVVYGKSMSKDDKIKLLKSLEDYWEHTFGDNSPMDTFVEIFLRWVNLGLSESQLHIKFPEKYVAYSNASPDLFLDLQMKGYKVCKKGFADLGMPTIRDLMGDARAHDVVVPNNTQKKKILILKEALRKLSPALQDDHFTASELDTHIYMFDKTSPKDSKMYSDCNAEAIIDKGVSKGFWIEKSYLDRARFSDALETALHELSHKAGGDESAEFSYKLTNVNKDAIDMLMNDVQTRNEMQALSNLWNSLD